MLGKQRTTLATFRTDPNIPSWLFLMVVGWVGVSNGYDPSWCFPWCFAWGKDHEPTHNGIRDTYFAKQWMFILVNDIGKGSWNHGSICDWSCGLLQNLFSWVFLRLFQTSKVPSLQDFREALAMKMNSLTCQHMSTMWQACEEVTLCEFNILIIGNGHYQKWWFSSSQTVNFPGDTVPTFSAPAPCCRQDSAGSAGAAPSALGALAKLSADERESHVLSVIRQAASSMHLEIQDDTPLMEAEILICTIAFYPLVMSK